MRKRAQKAAQVVPFTPTASRLETVIHRLALDSDNIRWSVHAHERMEQRGVDDIDVLHVLRTGHVEPDIVPGKNAGEWKCKIVKALKGRRELGVVTIVVREESLFLKTVEWEDIG